MAGHCPDFLISGQRLDGRKAFRISGRIAPPLAAMVGSVRASYHG
jgi:hypothetical protein